MTSYFPPTPFHRDPSAWLHQWGWRGQWSADESKYGHRYPRLVPPAYCSSVPCRPTLLGPTCAPLHHAHFNDLTSTPLNISMGIIIKNDLECFAILFHFEDYSFLFWTFFKGRCCMPVFESGLMCSGSPAELSPSTLSPVNHSMGKPGPGSPHTLANESKRQTKWMRSIEVLTLSPLGLGLTIKIFVYTCVG